MYLWLCLEYRTLKVHKKEYGQGGKVKKLGSWGGAYANLICSFWVCVIKHSIIIRSLLVVLVFFAWSCSFKAQFLGDCSLLHVFIAVFIFFVCLFFLPFHLLGLSLPFSNIPEDKLRYTFLWCSSLLTVSTSFHQNPNLLWKSWLGFSPRFRLVGVAL